MSTLTLGIWVHLGNVGWFATEPHPVLGCLMAEEIGHAQGFAWRYRAGEVIFRKGDAGQSMLVIAAGKVVVVVC